MTQERLKELLHYDPETGIFTNRVDRGRRSKAGQRAGSRHTHGHWSIGLDGFAYLGHRLVWLYMTGVLPRTQLYHLDGDKCNNRYANLAAKRPKPEEVK